MRNTRRKMRYAFLITILCGFVDTLDAAPMEVKVEQITPKSLSGHITLREPVTDRILGTYEFISGGCGKGSAPYGRYTIGYFRDDGRIGRRWMLRQDGEQDDGNAYDPRIDTERFALELHAKRGKGFTQCTLGCIGVFGGPSVWDKFVDQMRFLKAWGPVTFTLHPSNRPLMLFLHGMQSRYGKHKPAEIEAQARAYADAKGYDLEVLNVSGDQSAKQERLARKRLAQGDVAAVYGFSAGGYTADRIQSDFPELVYVKIGAPGTKGDIELSGVEHMDMPRALAKSKEFGSIIAASIWLDRA